MRRAAGLWAALATGLACASAPEPRVETLRSDAEVDGSVSERASVVFVSAESPEAAWGRIVRARTEAPLEESELLARTFDLASGARVEVVAGGPHSALNEQVLIDALRLVTNDLLPGLQLVYVSPEAPRDRLVELLALRRVHWRHAPWRGEPGR